MTASMPNTSLSWDRVLPAPDALLNGNANHVLPRRSSSLLQHHLFSSRDPLESPKDRRSTVPSVSYQVDHRISPIRPIPLPRGAQDSAIPGQPTIGPLTRKRAASSMADEPKPKETSSGATQDLVPEATDQFCLCQPDPKIPRPRNAFILYRQHHQAAVVAKHPGLPNPEISKIIGEEWRALPPKTKSQWKALAEEEKLRHQQQYPDYRYQPRRLGRNGNTQPSSSPNSGGQTGKCFRCGGKTMNPPLTPHTPLFPSNGSPSADMLCSPTVLNAAAPPTPRHPYPLVHTSLQRQMPYTMSSPPPPGSGLTQVRPFGEVFASVAPPSMSEAEYRARIGAQALSPEPKRRRFNGPGVMVPARGADPMSPTAVYPHGHPYSPQRVSLPRPTDVGLHAMQQRAGPQVQTPRASYAHQHPRYTSIDARDPGLTLAPLRTPTTVAASAPLTSHRRPSSAAVAAEAQIMSIPIVNKLRLLSKAAPPLPYPTPVSRAKVATSVTTTDNRGAILAIEGSAEDVSLVTGWLTDFLKNERDGFGVRIFRGPDISAVMARADSEEGIDMVGTHQQRYLNAISEWHGVSQEVVKFVTTAPKTEGGAPTDSNGHHNTDVEAEEEREKINGDDEMDLDSTSPNSAISPRTIVTRGQRQSLESRCYTPAGNRGHQGMDTSPPPPSATAPAPRAPHSPSPTTKGCTKPSAFPIAILPHYQLSTVDTASLTMPITDSYLPIDHWQWAAALWRGCVGADVTIVVQDDRSNNKPGPISAGGVSGGSTNDGGGGVEVKLGHGDVRAVIVRKGNGNGNGNGSGEKVIEAGALRRLGFEIVEFLRR